MAAVFVLAPGTASAQRGGATIFVHSAKSGELQGGRLTLRGVGRHLTWTTNGGRTGRVTHARLHRRLFLPGVPPATGTLHVVGRPPGRELALKLSQPRYNALRRTVSYRAKRLSKRAARGRAAAAAQRRPARGFGRASLSIVGASPVLGGSIAGGHNCVTYVRNNTDPAGPRPPEGGYGLQAIWSTNWPTDTWYPDDPVGAFLGADGGDITYESEGGFLRGCSSTVVWQLVYDPDDPAPGSAPGSVPSATFTIETGYAWGGQPDSTCTSSNPQFSCEGGEDYYEGSWLID